jgi:anti-sigma regulatory factor (Ser/Thr protein kinase)
MRSGSLELRLQARPEFAPMLRDRLRTWLEAAGASEPETFEMLLAGAEVFANAVEHPQEPTSHLVEVHGTITDEAVVTVSIRDYGKWQSEDVHKEQGGLGLVIVEALMDSFHVDFFEDGTTVTMERRLGAGAKPGHPLVDPV